MPAITCHHASPKLLSPLASQLLPSARRSPPPRAISIPTPNRHIPTISVPVPDHEQVEEAATAFWDYQFLFVSQRSETATPVKLRAVAGAIPADFPQGTYYLAGPGLFKDDHGSTVHPLDGHGYLRAFTLGGGEDGHVEFMARYVKTEAQDEEHDPISGSWKFTHRGPFSVLKAGKKVGNTKVMKNVANTSVLRWGGRLLCLWEGGDPYQVEPGTLDTVGIFEVGDGLVDGGSRGRNVENAGYRVGSMIWDAAANILKPILHGVFNMPPKRMLSHYKIDPKRNRLLMVSCNSEDMLLPRSNFTFYEFDSEFKMAQCREFTLPDQFMIHDWAFTDSYYILFGNRIKVDPFGSLGAVSGLSPMISALSVNPSKATSPIYLLPRHPSDQCDDGLVERDWTVPIEVPSQLWLLHVGNAFQTINEDDGTLDIHLQAAACSYDWFNFQKMFGYNWQSGKLDPSIMNINRDQSDQFLPHLVQVSMSLDGNGNCKSSRVEPLCSWRKPSDFPVINQAVAGSRSKYIYAGTSSGRRQMLPHFPFDSVVKIYTSTSSAQTWSAGNRRFVGEPIFVPKETDVEEDGGYILLVEYAVSIQRCYLVILDAKKIGETDALVAKFEVPKHLNFPLGFHGFWASGDS